MCEIIEEPVIEYPCDFPLSIIGLNSSGFPSFVMEILRRHIPSLEENAYSIRPSRDARYLSVKVKFIAESRSQLDELYRELTSQESILWVV